MYDQLAVNSASTASIKPGKYVCAYEKVCAYKKSAPNNPSLRYFTTDAWQVVSQVLDIKRVCNKEFQDGTAIACDCCLDWFHLGCVGLKSAPKQEWFCRFCCGKDIDM